MALLLVGLLTICYTFGLLFFAIWDVKKNWKLPRSEKKKNGVKYFWACFGLFLLLKYGEPYATRIDYENDSKKAVSIITQAITLMSQSAELKECKRKIEAGELTHVAAYVNCQEPFILEAYKEAGVTRKDSLQSLSNIWLDMATKGDKGEPVSQEKMGNDTSLGLRRLDSNLFLGSHL